MLVFMRKWIAGWVAAVVVVLFCLPLLLFGTNYYFDANVNPLVASGDGVEIRLQDFRRSLEELRQRYRSSEVPLPPEQELRETLLWSLIDGGLVLEYAKGSGMRISPKAVVDVIRNFESLQQDGIFDRAAYEEVRKRLKDTLGSDIEDNVRAELVPMQLQAAVTMSSFLLEDEVLAIARLNAEKRDFAYASLLLQDVMDEIEVEQEEIEQWYDENHSLYQRPERVKLEYVEIRLEELLPRVEVEEESLEAYYNGRSEQYDIEERRRASHLYQQVSGTDEALWEAAREKMRALRQRLVDEEAEATMETIAEEEAAAAEEKAAEEAAAAAEEKAAEEAAAAEEEAAEADAAEEEVAGEDAAEDVVAEEDAATEEEVAGEEVAEEEAVEEEVAGEDAAEDAVAEEEASEEVAEEDAAEEEVAEEQEADVPDLPVVDMVSQGLSTRSEFMPDIVDIAFAMEVDEISELVETANGIHIVRLDEISEGRVSTFENSREDAEEDYRGEQAAILYLELAEELATMAYESPDDLEEAADVLELELEYSDWLERGGSGEAPLDDSRVQAAAFSAEVLDEGLNSELLELSGEHVVVVRLSEHEEAALKELDQVREQASEDLRRDIASRQLLERGEEALRQLRDEGLDADAVASDVGFSWEQAESVDRNSDGPPRNVLREAFRMSPPAGEDDVVYLGKETGSGDYMLIQLRAVQPVEDDSAIAQEEIDQVWQQYSTYIQRGDWGLFMEALRSVSDVEIFQDRIDQGLGEAEAAL